MKSVFGRTMVFAAFAIILLFSGAYAQEWEKEIVSQSSFAYKLMIGDADNDDRNEIYSIEESNLNQFYWNQTTLRWDKFVIDLSSIPYIIGLFDSAIGDADNDGEDEIYVSLTGVNPMPYVYKLHYNSTIKKWNSTQLFNSLGDSPSLRIGDGDNDGKKEIYTQTWGNTITRFKFTDKEWQSDALGAGYEIMVGDGNNDGKNEVYTTTAGSISKFMYFNGSWEETRIYPDNGFAMGIGDGDYDGRNELYFNPGYEMILPIILQLRPNNSTWDLTDFWMDGYLFDSSVNDADNDGKNEIYAFLVVYKV